MIHAEALRLTEVLIGWSSFLWSIELWKLRLSNEFSEQTNLPPILPWFLFAAALATVIQGGWVFLLMMLFGHLWVAACFSGFYNGGSDSMGVQILLGALLARFGHEKLGMQLIATQMILSYALAGFSKMRKGQWLNGTAIKILAIQRPYGAPVAMARLLQWPLLMSILATMICIWELSFLSIPFSNEFRWLFLVSAGFFHLLNFWAFGLNRFFWIWLSGFPAILYVSTGA